MKYCLTICFLVNCAVKLTKGNEIEETEAIFTQPKLAKADIDKIQEKPFFALLVRCQSCQR